MKLSVFNLGDAGVNLTKSPLHVEDGEWLRLQNAALELRGADHGIAKRLGMNRFAGSMAGAVFALINAGVVVPVPPPSEQPTGGGNGGNIAAFNIMRCKLYLTAATTSVADNTPTNITWTAEAWDVGNIHDLVTNADRLTVPTDGDGLYLLIAQARWATLGNNVKKKTLRLYKNGTGLYGEASIGADDDGDSLAQQVAALVPAVAGDYFTVSVEQDSGAALNLVGNGEEHTWVTAIRLVATTETVVARAHVYRGSNLSLAKDTPTIVGFDYEAIDTHAIHDTVTNNSRLTVPTGQDGGYIITAQYALQAPVPVNSYVHFELLKNGTQVLASSKAAWINATEQPDTAQTFGGFFEMVAGDYVEVRATARLAARVLLGVATADALSNTSLSMARVG